MQDKETEKMENMPKAENLNKCKEICSHRRDKGGRDRVRDRVRKKCQEIEVLIEIEID